MWALRPDSLEDASLAAALKRLTDRYSEETRATADTTVVGTPRPLSPEIEVTLLRIAQEALSNCRKYARASQVLITLSYMNNLVLLNVEDNGVGFDPAKPHTSTSDHSGGFGLKGMRKRVEQLSGTLLIDSASGSGTTLMVALPVAGDKQPAQGTRPPQELPS
jgi:signal transduction histidine kinase